MQRRSEARAERRDEVRIKGADAHGVNFDERAHTVNLSEHGLALLTPRDLVHSATLTVTIRGRGGRRPGGGRSNFLAQAMVAYVFPDGALNRVGLQFIGATLAM
ncbi:MAG: PilZ domain-containing protein [Terriglobia bacterium]